MSSAVRRGRRSKRPCAISWPTTRATPRSLLDGRHSRAQFSKRKRSNRCGGSSNQDDAYLRDRLGLAACDAILWGRTTYERFAKRWPGSEGAHPYVARLNAIQKYVFSSKLESADWYNSTIVRGDVSAEVTGLKQQDGGDLLILGHGLLEETLLKQRLLDVLDLAIHPVLVGHGKPFFREGQAVKVKLATTKSFSKLVKITYEPQY